MPKPTSHRTQNTWRLVSIDRPRGVGDDILDARGKICPMPALLVKRKLDETKAGCVLKVIVEYPQSRDNIVRVAERLGHQILDIKEGAGDIEIYIQKTPKCGSR